MKKLLFLTALGMILVMTSGCQPEIISSPDPDMRGVKVGPVYVTVDLVTGIVTFSNTLNEGVVIDLRLKISPDSSGHLGWFSLCGFGDTYWPSAAGYQLTKYDQLVFVYTWRGVKDTVEVGLDDRESPNNPNNYVWRWAYDGQAGDLELWFDHRNGLNRVWLFNKRIDPVSVLLKDADYDEVDWFSACSYGTDGCRLPFPIPRELHIYLWESSSEGWGWEERDWIKF